MRFLLYGDANTKGSGGWCYAETLRELGHEVESFSETTALGKYQSTMFARFHARQFGSAWEPTRRRHTASLREVAVQTQPDICIILKGVNVSAADICALRKTGAWVVNINHDDFFSQHRTNWSKVQREALPFYDYIFTTREVNVAELAHINARTEFFPFAYFPRIHRPVPIPAAEHSIWDADVVFVGNWEIDRSKQLEALVQRVPARYSIWGWGWKNAGNRSPLVPFLHGHGVMLDEMAKALGGARVALGFLRRANRDDYTQRTFEIPACNGVLLAERTARHQQLFSEGIEAEFFEPTSIDELAAKVQGLLTNDTAREAIRAAGHLAVTQRHHTYEDRLLRLIEVYNGR
jgi:spore maturation protein CgeB